MLFWKKKEMAMSEALPPQKNDACSRLQRVYSNICIAARDLRYTSCSSIDSNHPDLYFLLELLEEAERECGILIYDTPPEAWLAGTACAQSETQKGG